MDFKLLLFCGFLFLGLSKVNAQVNLELNDVLFLEFSQVIPAQTSFYTMPLDTSFIVPTGKVYKIESIGHLDANSVGLTLNNNLIMANNEFKVKFPIWLPEGTYNIHLIHQGISSIDVTQNIYFSILEFNKN